MTTRTWTFVKFLPAAWWYGVTCCHRSHWKYFKFHSCLSPSLLLVVECCRCLSVLLPGESYQGKIWWRKNEEVRRLLLLLLLLVWWWWRQAQLLSVCYCYYVTPRHALPGSACLCHRHSPPHIIPINNVLNTEKPPLRNKYKIVTSRAQPSVTQSHTETQDRLL